jgi:uncharacterized OB-fold protein
LPNWKDDVDVLVDEGKISVPYSWTVGSILSRFYCELRDNAKIWANRCPSCGKVFVPPKIKCIDCYEDLHDWMELPGTGTVETAYGIIKMDGADTGMVHFIGDVDPEEVKVGMRVEAVFEDEREGNILDIKHFRPIA